MSGIEAEGRNIEEKFSERTDPFCADALGSVLLKMMHENHANREYQQTEIEALEKRLKTTSDLLRYLSFVPIGKGGKDNRSIDPEERTRLFNERGCCCEACLRKIEGQDFDIHHTNYYKSENPEYLKVMCRPCHRLIGVLTGMVAYFENQMLPTKNKVTPLRGEIIDVDEKTIEEVRNESITPPAYTTLFRRRRQDDTSTLFRRSRQNPQDKT